MNAHSTLAYATSVALLAATLIAGCGGSSGDAEGTAPTIRDLTLTPTSIAVGAQATMTGALTFDDPDGDLSQVGVEITLPNGTKQALPKSAVQGASGLKEGPVDVALVVLPPTAGTYGIDVFVVDQAGHESNHLTVDVTAQ